MPPEISVIPQWRARSAWIGGAVIARADDDPRRIEIQKQIIPNERWFPQELHLFIRRDWRVQFAVRSSAQLRAFRYPDRWQAVLGGVGCHNG